MFREYFSSLFHAVDNAFGEFRFTEIMTHGLRQSAPEFIPAFFMDGFITNHGKFVRARRNKNQDAIVLRGISHTQADKFFLRFGNRVFDVLMADQYADLA